MQSPICRPRAGISAAKKTKKKRATRGGEPSDSRRENTKNGRKRTKRMGIERVKGEEEEEEEEEEEDNISKLGK